MFLGLLVAVLIAAEPAPAKPSSTSNVTAKVQSIVDALKRAGYPTEVRTGDEGVPYIVSEFNGREFRVLFFGCKKEDDCATVQFYAGFTGHQADLVKINIWNAENRFGRAYLWGEGVARVEMDVDLDDGGMSQILFEDNIWFWIAIMKKFQKHIYDEPAKSSEAPRLTACATCYGVRRSPPDIRAVRTSGPGRDSR